MNNCRSNVNSRRRLARGGWTVFSVRQPSVYCFLVLVALSLGTIASKSQQEKTTQNEIEVQGEIRVCGDGEVVRGETFEFEVRVFAKGIDPQLSAQPPRVRWPSDLVVAKDTARQESRARGKAENREVEQAFIYEGVVTSDASRVVIGALPVDYWIRGDTEARTLVIPGTTVQVLEVGAQKFHWPPSSLFFTAGVFVVVLGTAACLILGRRKALRTSSASGGKPKDPPGKTEGTVEGKFLRQLAASQKLWLAGEENQYYAEVEKSIYQFIYEKYRVEPQESQDDLSHHLRESGMDPKRAEKLVALLNTCHEIRFSSRVPSSPEHNRFQRELEEVVRSSDKKGNREQNT